MSSMRGQVDVFISYSHNDKAIADGMCAWLEGQAGLRCWYAPRDILPGEEWANSIVQAIGRARYFVLIFSENSNRSGQVFNEVSNAFERGCTIIPFQIVQVEMSDRMSYYLKGRHWLDAVTPPMEDRFAELANEIKYGLAGKGFDDTTRQRGQTQRTAAQRGADQPYFDILGRMLTPVAAVEFLEACMQKEQNDIQRAKHSSFSLWPLLGLGLAIAFSVYFCWFQFPLFFDEEISIDDIGLVWGPFRAYLATYENFTDSLAAYAAVVLLYPIFVGFAAAFLFSVVLKLIYYMPRASRTEKKAKSNIERMDAAEAQIIKAINPYLCYLPPQYRTSEKLSSIYYDYINHLARDLEESLRYCEQKGFRTPTPEVLWYIPYQPYIGDLTAVRRKYLSLTADENFLSAERISNEIMRTGKV